MVRRYLLAGLFVMIFGASGIINAANTTVRGEDDTESSGFSVENASGVERLGVSSAGGVVISRLTTAERDALTPESGMMIFNTTTSQFEGYDGTVWIAFNGVAAATSFTCGLDQTTDADGNMYDTVEIGGRCWMAENLNVGTRIDSTDDQTDNGITEKYCYDNLDVNCATDGGLYQWDEMMGYLTFQGSQGICPTGWHLPSDIEWKDLEITLGMSPGDAELDSGTRGTDQGDQLKIVADCANGINCGISGFQALLVGFLDTGGTFNFSDLFTAYWTSSENTFRAWNRVLTLGNAGVARNDDDKTTGFSVRCVKN